MPRPPDVFPQNPGCRRVVMLITFSIILAVQGVLVLSVMKITLF